MAKMTLKPPTRTAEEFIKAANQATELAYPWDQPQAREDVIKSVNLRLTEPLLLKLQYLSKKTRKSQQALIREALIPYLDSLLNEV